MYRTKPEAKIYIFVQLHIFEKIGDYLSLELAAALSQIIHTKKFIINLFIRFFYTNNL